MAPHAYAYMTTALAILGAALSPSLAASADDTPVNTDAQTPITFTPSSGAAPALLGFGTWNLNLSPANTSAAVSAAIQAGYRHIDCAAIYRNEVAVGEGIADGLARTGLKREELWVTGKLWNDGHGAVEEAERALERSLEDLGVAYLDLWLMHWPISGTNKLDYVSTWHSMEKLLKTDKVRHIGVANFSPHQLKFLMRLSDVKPAVHQMELHPYLQQSPWVRFHQRQGIHVTAYSPFGNANPTYRKSGDADKTPPLLLEDEMLGEIAAKRNCTPAQVALAWGIHRGTSVIPKTSHEQRILENRDALQCRLEEPDLGDIEELGTKHLKRFNNPGRSWGVGLFEGLDDA